MSAMFVERKYGPLRQEGHVCRPEMRSHSPSVRRAMFVAMFVGI